MWKIYLYYISIVYIQTRTTVHVLIVLHPGHPKSKSPTPPNSMGVSPSRSYVISFRYRNEAGTWDLGFGPSKTQTEMVKWCEMGIDTVDGSEIRQTHQLIGRLSHYLQGFSTIPGWCRISSINSMNKNMDSSNSSSPMTFMKGTVL